MKPRIQFLSGMIIFLLALGACSDQKPTEDSDQEVTSYLEPDNYFEDAVAAFEDEDPELANENIQAAMTYMKSVPEEDDTVHRKMIDLSLQQLKTLSDDIEDGNVTSSDQLKAVFSAVDRSLAMYHLMIIEDWVLNETNDVNSLARMHRAIIRTNYAIAHAEIELNEEESEVLAKAIDDVKKAEKVSLELWKNIVASLKRFNDRMEQGANPLDGSI